MHQLKIKFIRKSGNQYQFELKSKKVFIENMVLSYERYSTKLIMNNGSPGWFILATFVSLRQVEKAYGSHITTDEWFKEYMRVNPEKWGKSNYKNEYQITKGWVKIVDILGEVYRIKAFENHRAKAVLLSLFKSEIRNLPNYFIEVGYS